MKTQKLLYVLMSAGIAATMIPFGAALAANNETQQTVSAQGSTQQTQQQGATDAFGAPIDPVAQPVVAQPDASGFPYEQTFIISAYYSPLAGQKKYVTGSYDGDIRLNGNGVHGADGLDVHPGMIAAPKNYPFGTKMNIPGVGTVGVHDRGGAIVNAGQRNQSYDRLDLWMGSGDAGLERALHWGRRTVQVTVYGVDPNVQENVNLEGFSAAESVAETVTGQAPKVFVQDLNLGNTNDDVKKLQDSLKQLGYYSANSTGTFDDATRQALIKFQIAAGLVDSENDFGAGYFGPQTRKSLEDALNQKQTQINDHLPQTPLSKDDQGDDVKKLQVGLQKLGYDVQVTGIYDDQTVNAILKFQKDHNVVSSDSDFGAGVFGPKTMQVLALNLVGVSFDDANAAQETSVQPVIVFTQDLKLGDSGADVTRLQQELQRMNYLGIAPSGYYGDVTQHAVMKFQEAQGLIQSENDPAAGYFGSGTRASIHAIIGERQHVNDLMSQKNPLAKKEEDVALK